MSGHKWRVALAGVVVALSASGAMAQGHKNHGSAKPGIGVDVSKAPPKVDTEPHPPMPPMPQASGPCRMDLTGSVWMGHARWSNGMDHDWWLQFKPKGVLAAGYWGTASDMGTWTQKGDNVTFEFNGHFADYKGAMSMVEITGTMTNVRSDTGEWHVTRECSRKNLGS